MTTDLSLILLLVTLISFALMLIVLFVLPYWYICAKAGYSGALSLLMLLPVVNLVFLLYLAFADWPLQRELRELRHEKQLIYCPLQFAPPEEDADTTAVPVRHH